MLILTLAAFLLFAAPLRADLPTTYQVDNLSPTILYDPPLCGAREEGYSTPVWGANLAGNAWQTTYTDTDHRFFVLVKTEWRHYTWAMLVDGQPAPTATLSFVGREVTVVGPPSDPHPSSSSNGTVQVEVDGKVLGNCTETPSQRKNATMNDAQARCKYAVEWGRHNLTVRLIAGAFAIDHFEISTGNDEEQTPIQVPCANGTNVKEGGPYSLTPSWLSWYAASRPLHDDVNSQEWTRATTTGHGASIFLTVPRGTIRVSVMGAVDLDHGPFHVILTPPSYGLATFQGNAFNYYSVQGLSIFDTVLDPALYHSLQITNLAPDGAYFDISQFQFYQAKVKPESNGGLSGGLSGGALTGIVVGSVAGIAVAALLGWLIYRCRHKRKRRDQIDIEPEVSEVVYHTIDLYRDDGQYRATGTSPTHPTATLASTSSPNSSPLPDSSSKYSSLTPLTHGASPQTIGMPALAAEGAPAAMQHVQHVHHTDAGSLPQPQAQAAVLVDETPPTYNPDWAGPSSDGDAGGAGSAGSAQFEKFAPVASAP